MYALLDVRVRLRRCDDHEAGELRDESGADRIHHGQEQVQRGQADRGAARTKLQVEEADALRHKQSVAPHGRQDHGAVHVPHQGITLN